jgi:hypothetical protein
MPERFNRQHTRVRRILRAFSEGRLSSVALLALACLILPTACRPADSKPRRPTDALTAESYVRRAIHESAQGIVIFDLFGQSSGQDLVRLREIAQELRTPAAQCFLARGIETIELSQSAEGRELLGVPSGQAKFRVHLTSDGRVARSDAVENGFSDQVMVSCLKKVIEAKFFPKSSTGMPWTVDLVYWVNLGFHSQLDAEEFKFELRRQVALASSKAVGCFRQAGAAQGTYTLNGLNLVSPNGVTMVNRIRAPLPDDAIRCLEVAYRPIRVAPELDSFARPLFFDATFHVLDSESITFDDAEWLRLTELESAAQAGAERSEEREEPPTAADTPQSQPSVSPPVLEPSASREPSEPSAAPKIRLSPRVRPSGSPD